MTTKIQNSNRKKQEGKPQGATAKSIKSPRAILPGLTLEYCDKNGLRIWRQPSAKNEFNPTGLSLNAINMELGAAFAPQMNSQLLIEHQADEAHRDPKGRTSRLKEFQAMLASTLLLGDDKTDLGGGPAELKIDPSLMERILAVITPGYLIQEGDAAVAELIKECPLSVLASHKVQACLARWIYASNSTVGADIRKQAQDLLAKCFPAKAGTPGKTAPNKRRLSAAYLDLKSYCTCIISAAGKKPNEPALLKLFPDANKLQSHGLVLGELLDHRFKKPAPSAVATNYISTFSGLSTSRVTDLTSKGKRLSD